MAQPPNTPNDVSAIQSADEATRHRRKVLVRSAWSLSVGLLFVFGNILAYVFTAPPSVPWYKAYGDFRFFIGLGFTIWGAYGLLKLRAEGRRNAVESEPSQQTPR